MHFYVFSQSIYIIAQDMVDIFLCIYIGNGKKHGKPTWKYFENILNYKNEKSTDNAQKMHKIHVP
jgi:hypothetical protein